MFEYAGEGDTEKHDIDLTELIIDWGSLKTGWGFIEAGNSDWQWAPIAGTSIEKPVGEYKPAFQLDVYLTKEAGAPAACWVPWRSTGVMNRNAVQAIEKPILAAAKANAGKAAVVKVKEIVKAGKNNNNQPVLELVKWIAMPGKPESGVEDGFVDWKSQAKKWRLAMPGNAVVAGDDAKGDEEF
jgi:hypothetical protein